MDTKNLYLIGLMICIVMISGCTNQPSNQSPLEQSCRASGGTIGTQLCCGSALDFPNTCAIGSCGCSPQNSKETDVCNCGEGKCFDGNSCVSTTPSIASFEECVAAGYPVMETYPRQCRTPDGRNFVEEIINPLAKLCNDSGGNWNICSSKCMLDHQGKDGVACTMMCEALCECGGIAGFKCPAGYSCVINSNVTDALGYCAAKTIGGQRDEQRRREYEDSSSNKQDEKAGSTAREYTEK